jgi:hypothetical protein
MRGGHVISHLGASHYAAAKAAVDRMIAALGGAERLAGAAAQPTLPLRCGGPVVDVEV